MPREKESPAVPGGAFAGVPKRVPGHFPDTATAPAGQRGCAGAAGGGTMLFEQEHGRLLWRLMDSEWNGQRRIQIWPWYQPKDGGDPRPCSPRYGTGGFAIPLERVPEMIAALSAIAPAES